MIAFHCPHCGNQLMKEYPNGKVKFRTNIIVFENDKESICKCNVCHGDVNVPISLNLKKRGNENGKREGRE
jgi:hypothetical protein